MADPTVVGEPFFNVGFLRSVVTTSLGAFLALLLAALGWWITGRAGRKSASRRRTQLVQALWETIEFNLEVAKEASEVVGNTYFAVNIDLSLLESTRSLKYEVLDDINLSRDVDEVSYQFSSLYRLIAIELEMEFSGSFLASSARTQKREEMTGLIRERGTKAIAYENGKDVVRRLKEIAGTTQ